MNTNMFPWLKQYWKITLVVLVVSGAGLYWLHSRAAASQIESARLLQKDCGEMAQVLFDYWADMQPKTKARLGADSTADYDFASHYNKSLGRCIMSLHISRSTGDVRGDWYSLEYADGSSSQTIGKLSFGTVGKTVAIVDCVINGLPCTSIEEYTRLAAPYLKE